MVLPSTAAVDCSSSLLVPSRALEENLLNRMDLLHNLSLTWRSRRRNVRDPSGNTHSIPDANRLCLDNCQVLILISVKRRQNSASCCPGVRATEQDWLVLAWTIKQPRVSEV